jgi:hypothetical protein
VPDQPLTAAGQVEGHGTHRVAAQHRKELVGKAFVADSPNGRFVEGAAAVNGKVLTAAECCGKNLLYTFGSGPGSVTVHIHFGAFLPPCSRVRCSAPPDSAAWH